MKNQSIKLACSATMLVVAGLLTGCLGPKYVRPQVQAAPAFRGADDQAVSSDPKDSLGDQQWSTVFRQPELQELIKAALTNNYDLRIAAQHILEQQQQVRITRAAQLPTLSVGGSGIGAYLPGVANGDSTLSGGLGLGSLNGNVAWTPDFWGLYRKQTEAARDTLLAQQWAQRAVRMTLVQEVATDYFELRTLDRELEIAKQTAEVRRQSVDLTRRLEQGGAAPLSDLRQAEQLLYTATAQIPQLQQQIQETENDLKFLLGENPGTVMHTDPTAIMPVPENLPVGVPSQLLERRPDVQEAEAQLKAANAQVAVARAQFFPQLTLNFSGGTGGMDIADLVDANAGSVLGIASLTQPIFAGGKIRGQYELSKAQKEEMVLSYQKTVKGAFRDVSNALIAVNKQRAAREQQEKLVAAAQDATRLAELRYKGGSTSYLEVLTTASTLFSAQLTLATMQQGESLTLVQLYEALGGGWQ
ncbi:MAG: efflux transporter outer membrane subunit [Acidobacteriaceae bacterium]|nr:efflux transporter outer membrane subunit [Acidobacteriaceae bacterium]